jgi:hypothetical protein
VRLAIAVGLAVIAVALGVVLSGSPVTVIGTNGIPANLAVTFINGGNVTCQPVGTVPLGTEAVRVSLSVNTGPKVIVKVYSGSTLVTQGSQSAGWGIDETVTVPVKRVAQTIAGARICTTIGPAVEPIQVNGARVRTAGGKTAAILRMEYLRGGRRSWLSLASSIARNMAIDHAPNAIWIAYLVIAAMIAVVVLASRILLREARAGERMPSVPAKRQLGRLGRALRRLPRAAWVCMAIAGVSAACWSLVTPPFQAPDEPSHFAYTQLLAETGHLPNSDLANFSQEELTVLRGLHQPGVEWHPEGHTISSRSDQSQLREDLTLPLNRVGAGGAGVAAAEPPLYYSLETVPYYLGSGGTLLDQLELMRLLSALLGGLTALFTFLFVREALPRVPWAWTVGGLAAALSPLLGFTSGAMTPDSMLFTVSAAIFYCLARAFRRGFTRRIAVAIGALTAVGFLTKLNFIGLAPGVMLGLLLLAFRAARHGQGPGRRRRALASLAIAIGIAISPVCVYVLSNLLEHHHLLGLVSSAATEPSGKESIFSQIAYIWQLYLPRLPGMVNYFPGLSTLRQMWFDRAVGLYGWLDTSFPVWVCNLALIPAALIVLLGLRTLLTRMTALRSRVPEILVYLVMSVGLMALVGKDSQLHRLTEGAGWAQPRYLMPLLPLAAAVLVLAARGAGKRWGPAVGALIVLLFFAQDIFSQLLVVARFYG